mmetsp:Transcript_79898/g.247873  ORF Transcript_79898/g.247873 Transcript_79898/m.247873 type:complete len:333 (+) Transcript_79898:333-1331(+)
MRALPLISNMPQSRRGRVLDQAEEQGDDRKCEGADAAEDPGLQRVCCVQLILQRCDDGGEELDVEAHRTLLQELVFARRVRIPDVAVRDKQLEVVGGVPEEVQVRLQIVLEPLHVDAKYTWPPRTRRALGALCQLLQRLEGLLLLPPDLRLVIDHDTVTCFPVGRPRLALALVGHGRRLHYEEHQGQHLQEADDGPVQLGDTFGLTLRDHIEPRVEALPERRVGCDSGPQHLCSLQVHNDHLLVGRQASDPGDLSAHFHPSLHPQKVLLGHLAEHHRAEVCVYDPVPLLRVQEVDTLLALVVVPRPPIDAQGKVREAWQSGLVQRRQQGAEG